MTGLLAKIFSVFSPNPKKQNEEILAAYPHLRKQMEEARKRDEAKEKAAKEKGK